MTREDFEEIKHLSGEGLSDRAIQRRTGIHRSTVRKALNNNKIPKRQATRRGSMLDPYQGFLMGKLQQYPELTAARLHDMLKEQGFTGGYSLVKQAVAALRPRLREVHESLHFEPGEYAQVDWGIWKKFKVTNGERRLSLFVMVLCDSRMIYAELFPSETLEYWLEAHRRAFEYFGGVPKYVTVDNCKTAVIKAKGRSSQTILNPDYAAFADHCGFEVDTCTPHRPNEKGRVEHAVGYLKKAFLAGREPLAPEILNPALRDFLAKTANTRTHGTTGMRPVDAFEEVEKATLQPLPIDPPACVAVKGCVANSCCRITADVNRYSVPPAYASRRLILHRSCDRIIVRTPEGELVADHPRHSGRNQEIVHPDHKEAQRQLNGHARENRRVAAFLGLGGVAADFLVGLKDKRTDYRGHLRRINDLAESRGGEAVAAALAQAHELHAYSADAVLNLLEARSRMRDATTTPLQPHLIKNKELLNDRTPQTDLEQYDRSTQQ